MLKSTAEACDFIDLVSDAETDPRDRSDQSGILSPQSDNPSQSSNDSIFETEDFHVKSNLRKKRKITSDSLVETTLSTFNLYKEWFDWAKLNSWKYSHHNRKRLPVSIDASKYTEYFYKCCLHKDCPAQVSIALYSKLMHYIRIPYMF